MIKVLLITGVFTLLTTTGCLVSEGGHGHAHGGFHSRSTVIVPGPVLVVPSPPVVRVRVN